ncbi:MAG: pilus assembly protein PilM [Phycisphaerae bacterium]|nr:pilus assembly protein PilM [Phycisphaerae bacterium]NIT59833.1 pilus assembly protein PilM [Fodinibius sp.]NIU11367.1 pilus assembly protein PilM [Phycisphaerae bacterium]NIU59144.1 pilus assembly protein PilM [Phycisphaerae bacterium]NIV14563.1 pilus assembly protein PilM [Fodinibius sp.]
MVKRCIGIDIGFSYLRAVQIMRTEDELFIEKVFSTQTRRSKDSQQEILIQLSDKHGFDLRSDVAISMPHDAVFFRNLETDFAGLEQIRQVPKSALEHNIPIEPDQIVAQVCSHRRLPDDKYSVLTAAVSKTSLHDRLNTLAGVKIHPNLVETAIFALHSTIVKNHPEIAAGQAIIAYIDESYLTMAVIENHNILIVRNIPIVSHPDNNADLNAANLLAHEAKVTWQKVFGTDIEQETKIYIAFGGDVSGDFEASVIESLRCQIVIVEPYAAIKCSPEHNGGKAICVAEGLALRALAPEENLGINFLKADNTDTKATLDLRKELITCATLVAAIVVVSIAGLFVRLFYLESKYTNIKNEIRQVFQNTLPEEKNIVNPLVQLEQQLVSFRKDNQLFASFYPTSLTPLKVLHNITTNTPSESNIKINDLLITIESVRLKGTCESFDSVYQWQKLLQEIDGFTLVDVENPQRNPKGDAIHFTILISLDRSPAIQE